MLYRIFSLSSSLALLFLARAANCEVLFEDSFPVGWDSQWETSKSMSDFGRWERTDQETVANVVPGIQTMEDEKYYIISRMFKKPFSSKGKTLYISYTVKWENDVECGGAFLKIFPTSSAVNQAQIEGATKYSLKFGPEICGSTKQIGFDFVHKGQMYPLIKTVTPPTDSATHLFTLIIDQEKKEFKIFVDFNEVQSGSLIEDFKASVHKFIPDPSAQQPEDWVIDEWAIHPTDEEKVIPNPDYKGPWVAPLIANPDYKEDVELGVWDDLGAIGFVLWQVKGGSIIGNIHISDDWQSTKVHGLKIKDLIAKERGYETSKPTEMCSADGHGGACKNETSPDHHEFVEAEDAEEAHFEL